MGNSLRCCLACVLPCGALDLIRVVHINGYVEEYSQPVTAREILEANPNHVISRPCSQGVTRRIMIVSPGSELRRGGIYFLIPASALLESRKKGGQRRKSGGQKAAGTTVEVPDREVRHVRERFRRRRGGGVIIDGGAAMLRYGSLTLRVFSKIN